MKKGEHKGETDEYGSREAKENIMKKKNNRTKNTKPELFRLTKTTRKRMRDNKKQIQKMTKL